ncbi:DNA-binding response regulator CreB [Klebsiella pneumoniae]|nr:DNA-binding response regulator CreB [Klebsiella pneumoniae]
MNRVSLIPWFTLLQQEGFQVSVFGRGLPALEAAAHQAPDVAILDVGLPDISGFELCRRLLTRYPALPVLFLTARSDEVDKLLGLEIGADDYIAKPFSPREVCARVRTVLRRLQKFAAPSPVVRVGEFVLDEQAAAISWFGQPLNLTALRISAVENPASRARSRLLPSAADGAGVDRCLGKPRPYRRYPYQKPCALSCGL